MAKTKILSMISALIMLSILVFSTTVRADELDTSTWRADCIQRKGFRTEDNKPYYQYWYLGSMKGNNARPYGDGEYYYSVLSLWNIWDELETPVYFEDFYTYTIEFCVSFEAGEAWFDSDEFGLGKSSISLTTSEYKNEIYGQTSGHTGDPTPSITANPLLYTQGGYGVPIETVFDNVAVGTEVYSDDDGLIRIVFSTPARTIEHSWDMLIVDLGMLAPAWVDDADADDIYISNFSVVYDKDLSAYESAVQAGLTEIGGKIDGLNNTIQQGQDQAHQDAEGIKDAINNQGQQEKEEATSGGNANVAALQSSMSDFDLTSYGDAIDTLMASLSYDGTDTTWTLPSSGMVPFLNTTLWEEQEIDLCPDYIVNLESFNLITVFTNFVVAIGCVYVVVNIFNDLLSTMNGGGSSGTATTSSKGGDDG